MLKAAAAFMAIALGLAPAQPAPAAIPAGGDTAPPIFVIAPGERAVVTLSPTQPPVLVSKGPQGSADAISGPKLDYSAENLTSAHLSGNSPQPDRLTFALKHDDANGFTLWVGDGYAYPVSYRAWLVFEKGDQRSYRPTSICPVLPGHYGIEGWRDGIVGVAVMEIKGTDPDHLACNDGSLLSATSDPTTGHQLYQCSNQVLGKPPPEVLVQLRADEAGAIDRIAAAWTPPGDISQGPLVRFVYAIDGQRLLPTPRALSVIAMVRYTSAAMPKTAQIVLALNGTELLRRPWSGYAKSVASPLPPQAQGRPIGFFGLIPISANGGDQDAGLRTLLADVGQPGAVIGVRIVGDDGSIIGQATYPVDRPAILDKATLEGAIAGAMEAAKIPAQCQKVSN